MSRRYFLAGLLVMTSAATMVAGGELSEQTITGRVVDAQTNQPVSDVNVWIPESMIVTKTDAWGEFVLREVPDSAFVLELRASRV